MPEGFKAGAHAAGGGRDSRDRPKQRFEKRITLQVLINWINQQNYDEYTRKELVKKASAYPYDSFKHFANNINSHVIKIRQEKENLRKERDERERMSVQMSVPEPGVDKGPIATELSGSECIHEGSTAGVPGSDIPKAEEEGESQPPADPLSS